jgi:hypothetical protein
MSLKNSQFFNIIQLLKKLKISKFLPKLFFKHRKICVMHAYNERIRKYKYHSQHA